MPSTRKIIILIFLSQIRNLPATTTITELTNTPGLYFDNLGTTQLYKSTWTLLINYNLTNFYKEFEQMKVAIHEIKNTCEQITQYNLNYTDCPLILSQISMQYRELETVQLTLTHNHSIKKRSLIDAGGYFLNYIFGTLDQHYALANDNNLSAIKRRQDFFSTLAKNHTSILDNTSNLIHKTHQDIQNQFDIFTKLLSKINFDINHEKLTLQLDSHFHTILSFTSLILSRLRETQTNILHTLSNYPTSSIQLLIPQLLLDELHNIETILPPTLHLPKRNNQLDYSLILKLSQIQSHIHEEQLITILHIPIIMNTIFHLYRTIPVPTKTEIGYSYIKSPYDTLLVSINRQQVTSLSTMEFHSCYKNYNSTYFCKLNSPIHLSKSTQFDCELKLLDHATSIPNTCLIKQAPSGDYWIQIGSNQYIFVLLNTQQVDVICNDDITHYSLNNTGIIQFPSKCQLRSSNIIIQSETFNSRISNSHFIPSISISKMTPNLELNPNIVKSHPYTFQINDPTRIHHITQQLQELKEFQLQEPNVNLHFITNSHTYILLLIFAFLTLISVLIINKLNLIHTFRQYLVRQTNNNNSAESNVPKTAQTTISTNDQPTYSHANYPYP